MVSYWKAKIKNLIFGKKEVIDQIVVTGDKTVLLRLLKYMAPPTTSFNIIEP